jgi:hypothetical protein
MSPRHLTSNSAKRSRNYRAPGRARDRAMLAIGSFIVTNRCFSLLRWVDFEVLGFRAVICGRAALGSGRRSRLLQRRAQSTSGSANPDSLKPPRNQFCLRNSHSRQILVNSQNQTSNIRKLVRIERPTNVILDLTTIRAGALEGASRRPGPRPFLSK